jgi:aminopeptidase N
MRNGTPKTIRLRDYKVPDFIVETVDLLFDLKEENTRVTSTLTLRRNPKGDREAPLHLDGENLTLISVKIAGAPVGAKDYLLSEEALQLRHLPDGPFQVEIVTEINPRENTALEGLYLSSGMFCTQCEAQGFRKITYFPDRPDVMAVYTTTLIAEKHSYPVLLSNGNLDGRGDLLDGRHFARWVDPFPKPSYLFALVAGQLACLEDQYTTASGRNVTLQVFAEPQDIDKCGHALESLKNAMRWDEERFGREYDLDLYMIVAVSHFNMGAMENKGLNIFNTKYVLASPETATDSDYEHIEGVIGHEYFHNWTGNRITCRDWFQLSLKEGLTVYRDQEFSSDRHSRPVKRIDEVNMLRNRQFIEDAGPLAHPVRPDSYIEINNFYTLTVYEKGAEVVRMLETLLGREGFRKGTDLYFDRHDGHAVTCDDFIRSMEDANQVDLTQFKLWYSQAGTPEVIIDESYDPVAETLTLNVRQSNAPSPGQPDKLPQVIPLAVGLLGPDGQDLLPKLEGEKELPSRTTRVLTVSHQEDQFTFVGVPQGTILSALRDFSAPVRLQQSRTPEELAFLLAHDSDAFNQWDAGQLLATLAIQKSYEGEDASGLMMLLVKAYESVAQRGASDLSHLALLLALPDFDYVASFIREVDPIRLHAAREGVRTTLADRLSGAWAALYDVHHESDSRQFDALSIGRRRLKNLCLDYLSTLDTAESRALCMNQFDQSPTMTDRIAALNAIVNSNHPDKNEALDRFYQTWKEEDLVVCKWFTLQATCRRPGGLAAVQTLMQHPAFDIRTPNHVRSLIGAFTQSNPANFHTDEGDGYRFLADQVIELNGINPQIASRMLTALTAWRRFDPSRQHLMQGALERVAHTPNLSSDVYEVASKALAK